MTRNTEEIRLIAPSPGVERKLVIHRYGEPDAGPKAYLQTALHADEWPGMLVFQKLIGMLDAISRDGGILGQIVVVPYANPIGLAQRLGGQVSGRYDFDGSGNFNRQWPDLSKAAACRLEGRLTGNAADNIAAVRAALRAAAADLPRRTANQELRAVLMGLSVDADFVLDVHCDSESLVHTYSNVRHRDLLAVLGAELGSPVNLLELDAGGGAFDEANAKPWWGIGEHLQQPVALPPACFGVTVELRGQSDVLEPFAEQDAAALVRFLQRQGVLAGDPGPLPQLSDPPSPLAAVDLVTAPRAGILGYHRDIGETVKAGDVIATLYDPAAIDPAAGSIDLRAGTDGLLFTRFRDKLVQPGDSIAKIAGTTDLDYRKAGSLLED